MQQFKTMAELFSDPDRHTKKSTARDATGVNVNSCDPTAVCWCLLGGIWKVYGSQRTYSLVKQLEAATLRKYGLPSFIQWQDLPETTAEDVHKLCVEEGV